MKYNLIIPGAMKSGTTTVIELLNQHPEISIAREACYFSIEENFKKGSGWYESLAQDKKIKGDKTTAYMFLPGCAKRIYEYNPNAKLLFVLRDPIKRAYSNYMHRLKQGGEDLSFKEAVALEDKRIKKDIAYGYVSRGFYDEQISRFLKYFSKEQMHFLILEKLNKDFESEMNNIISFLDVSKFNFNRMKRKNKTKMPLSLGFERRIRNMKSKNIQMALSNINSMLGTHKFKQIEKDDIEYLAGVYKKHNKNLQKMTGIDIDNYWM